MPETEWWECDCAPGHEPEGYARRRQQDEAGEQPDGTWHIDGVKRFITNCDGDDLFENIVHMVLARPEGAGPGTKGLSLFIVPKYHFDPETGELGERNGAFVTGLEHKMGLKASATCELTFGQHGTPAVGWLVNDTHNGIAQMFKVIEYARMMVGTKAIATLSTGYLNALEYAKSRVQGADLTQMTDKTAPRVTITHHPDVRRSLMTQKAYAEGLRALYLFTATHQDAEVAKTIHGIEPELAVKVNDLMLPIVKGVGSEQAYAKLTESLQTFGGSGFLQDYRVLLDPGAGRMVLAPGPGAGRLPLRSTSGLLLGVAYGWVAAQSVLGSVPMPQSSRSWRSAWSLGAFARPCSVPRCFSTCSSSWRCAGTLALSTSDGWLASLRRYCSFWNICCCSLGSVLFFLSSSSSSSSSSVALTKSSYSCFCMSLNSHSTS